MAEHACSVPSANQKARKGVHVLLEILPVQFSFHRASVERSKELLVCQRVQRCQGHIQQGQDSFECRGRGELHVALKQVELRQRHGYHLIAGAFDDQVTLLEQVKS